MAKSSRPLEQLLREGALREDFFYRLNVFPIHVPPLRERTTDIPLLARHFMNRYRQADGRSVRSVSASAMTSLMSYAWPGNVRELEDCIQHAVQVSTDGVIRSHDLPFTLQTAEITWPRQHANLKTMLRAAEQEMICGALSAHDGNMAAAARTLGLTHRVMSLRVRKYGIDPERFKRRHATSSNARTSRTLETN